METDHTIDRGPRTVQSIAHRLLIVFDFESFAGHARCHRSRATHGTIDRGPRTVPSIARHGHPTDTRTDTAEPRIRYYRGCPSGTVYLLFLLLNLRSGAQDSGFSLILTLASPIIITRVAHYCY